MWTRLFKLLVAIGDVRMREVLKARLHPRIDGSFYEVLYPRIEKALAGLEEPPPLSPSDATIVADLAARAKARLAAPPQAIGVASKPKRAPKDDAVSGEELLRLVLEEPVSDAPRLVYADWLLEQGDPRGDFITLQWKRAKAGLSKAEAKREKTLLAKHAREWLGAIEPVVGEEDLRYERGFVVACSANFRTKLQRETLMNTPLWSTVREIRGAPYELLIGDAMHSLRVVTGLDQTEMARLADAPRPLRFEEVGFALRGAGTEQVIGQARALPNVRRLTVVLPPIGMVTPPPVLPESVDWLLVSPLGRRIEALTIVGSATWSSFEAARPDLGAWLEAVRTLTALTSLTFDVQSNWRLTVTREASTRWALELRADDPSDRKTLEPILRGVPKDTFTRLTMPANASPGAAEEIERLVRGHMATPAVDTAAEAARAERNNPRSAPHR